MTTIRTSIRRLFECKWLCALSVAACWVLCVFFSACANRGIGPQGGPRDSIPPTPLTSIPENGSVNFQGGDIEVTFNEYLQLDNVSQNMLMSPPQQTPPEIKAIRRLSRMQRRSMRPAASERPSAIASVQRRVTAVFSPVVAKEEASTYTDTIIW